jgi:hypothetical protein
MNLERIFALVILATDIDKHMVDHTVYRYYSTMCTVAVLATGVNSGLPTIIGVCLFVCLLS